MLLATLTAVYVVHTGRLVHAPYLAKVRAVDAVSPTGLEWTVRLDNQGPGDALNVVGKLAVPSRKNGRQTRELREFSCTDRLPAGQMTQLSSKDLVMWYGSTTELKGLPVIVRWRTATGLTRRAAWVFHGDGTGEGTFRPAGRLAETRWRVRLWARNLRAEKMKP